VVQLGLILNTTIVEVGAADWLSVSFNEHLPGHQFDDLKQVRIFASLDVGYKLSPAVSKDFGLCFHARVLVRT